MNLLHGNWVREYSEWKSQMNDLRNSPHLRSFVRCEKLDMDFAIYGGYDALALLDRVASSACYVFRPARLNCNGRYFGNLLNEILQL